MRRVHTKSLNPEAVGTQVVQYVFQTCSAYTTTCSVIPGDDTLPQNTEGIEIVDAVIAPTTTKNIIVVEVNFNGLTSRFAGVAALFHSSSSNAKAAAIFGDDASSGTGTVMYSPGQIVLVTEAPSAASQSWSLRMGTNATSGRVFVNGGATSALFGGALFCSIEVAELATG